MTFEETWIAGSDEDRLIVKTNPRHQDVHLYEFHRRGEAWVPSGVVTGHVIEYARNNVEEPVLNRRLGDGQLQLSDFLESVESRSEVIAVG
ncbi:hypothetical protein SAMN06269185_1662 [Natronoarchaeum philippinense]|uniref:Uncharacterized protein n=1 Tax=Natronoarchaeum philippinense TaxID=558529 RepID=A0A285NS82_NATPI|nr:MULTISPECIES: hypothetical protein [Halobacteriales]SNZ12370.1 hypothetical protein SAMN06269185_1662 [Natronoarchaeum philippinense]